MQCMRLIYSNILRRRCAAAEQLPEDQKSYVFDLDSMERHDGGHDDETYSQTYYTADSCECGMH
jgi:hypothetical protein